MMLPADRQGCPQFNDSHRAGRTYTRHPPDADLAAVPDLLIESEPAFSFLF
jgi:hypothetical protein